MTSSVSSPQRRLKLNELFLRDGMTAAVAQVPSCATILALIAPERERVDDRRNTHPKRFAA